MSRARKPAGRRVAGGTGSRVGRDEPSALVKLGKRFARFRREHPRGTRIPDDLRAAALALLREVVPADLYRTCGISSGQVMAWKEAKARRTESQDVRVFSVVDEAPVGRPEPTLPAAEPALELRLGPWSVSVRLWGPETAGRR
jgi:hypothetical protein